MKTTEIKAVVFDAFGTIVEITNKKRPYRQLLEIVNSQDGTFDKNFSDIVMETNLPIEELAAKLNIKITPAQLEKLREDLGEELASIQLFPETMEVLTALKASGVQVGLCSNLAFPYGSPLKNILPIKLDQYLLSYEVGFIKPKKEMYEEVMTKLACTPAQIVFVGDTYDADYEGPRAAGMNALLLERNRLKKYSSIPDLRGVLKYLNLQV